MHTTTLKWIGACGVLVLATGCAATGRDSYTREYILDAKDHAASTGDADRKLHSQDAEMAAARMLRTEMERLRGDVREALQLARDNQRNLQAMEL